MNSDERKCSMVMNCVIRQLVILGNPFCSGLRYTLCCAGNFSLRLSLSCNDNGTNEFKECRFIVGRKVKKGNLSSLSCPTKGTQEQMHHYF